MMEEIDKAIKETFKTKLDQKIQMSKFQELLVSLETAQCNLKLVETQIEGFFDMIGLNKLSKQEWREKYLLTETNSQSVEKKDGTD